MKRTMDDIGCQALLILAALLVAADAAAGEQDGRLPGPDPAATQQAKQLVREVYAEKYEAATTPVLRQALAMEMVRQALQMQDEPVGRFVLLEAARKIAVAAGDCELSLRIVEETASRYRVDALSMKAEALEGLVRSARARQQRQAVAEAALAVMEAAVAVRDVPAAERLAESALSAARAARDATLTRKAIEAARRLQVLSRTLADYRTALERLEKTPEDPEANLAAGRYLCLVAGDWEKGLPRLARGSDAGLKAAASADLKGGDTPETRLAVADAWWELGKKVEGKEGDWLRVRAAWWYRKALPGLSGLPRVKAEKRLSGAPAVPATLTEPSGPAGDRSPERYTVKTYGWKNGDGEIRTVGCKDGLCLLSSVCGNFLGDGEWVRVYPKEDGYWYLAGGAVQGLRTGATSLAGLRPPLLRPRVAEFHWKKGSPPVRMLRKRDGFCFLSGVGGGFRGDGEWVRVALGKDDCWYLTGGSVTPVSARAIAVRATGRRGFQGEITEHVWESGQPAVKMLHRSEGFCVLSGIGGGFHGGGELVKVYLDEADGFWYLGGHGVKSIHGRALAIRLVEKAD